VVASDTVAEVVRVLNLLPEEQVVQVLKAVKDQAGRGRIASVLGGGITVIHQPSAMVIASSTLEQSFVSLELGALNPIAYPFLPQVDAGLDSQNTLKKLTQPRGASPAWHMYDRDLGRTYCSLY
jgi:hypothetical protein